MGRKPSTAGSSRRRYRWSEKSLEELEEFYWDEIATEMRHNGLVPDEEWPRYRWLVDHGFSGLDYALREHHDLTLREFFVDVVGVAEPNRSTDDYDWDIEHAATIRALEGYLRDGRWKNLADETLSTRRSHLAKYVRTYAAVHGTSDLLAPLRDVTNKREETDRVRAVAREMEDDLRVRTLVKYLQDVQRWYCEYLTEYERAEFDPTRNLTKRYDVPEPDNTPLSAEHVRDLYEACESAEERLVVLGLAGWGLRRSELAALHTSQIDLDADPPYLVFERRKNASNVDGPSTVTLVCGVEELTDRLETLEADPKWNGYLFPSRRAESGHIVDSTIYRRFRRLAERADVRVDGERPHPHQGRRFWYDTYKDAVADVIELAREIATDQGASDPRTIYRNYWSEAERRQLRRDAMRERLIEAFGGSE